MASIGLNLGELSYLDTAGETITGTIKADTLIWDAWKGVATDPLEFASLDGGAGNDSLTLKLTQEQFDNLLAEIAIDFPGVKVKDDGTLIADGTTFSGNNWVSLESLGLNVKMWENIKLEVVEPELSGTELVQNWDFEDNLIPAGDYIKQAPNGWLNEGATTPEVVAAPYGGLVPAPGETNWLDTAASPDGIHISTTADLADGALGQLSVSIATQNLDLADVHVVDGDETITFKYDGNVVLTVAASELDAYNVFETFTVDVVGSANAEKLEIITNDPSNNHSGDFVGFAVDHISLQTWEI